MKKIHLIFLLLLSFHTYSQNSEYVCIGNGTRATIHSSLITDGIYIVTYALSGSNTLVSSTANVNFVSGVGTLDIPSSQLPNVGATALTVLSLANSNTSCFINFPIPLIKNLIISPLPNVGGTNNLLVSQPLCPDSDATVNFKSSLIADGVYTITYSLSGANTLNNRTTSTTFVLGATSFIIPASQIPNVGTTNVVVTAISNTVSSCSSNFPPSITGSFVINDFENSLINTEYEFCIEESKKLKDLSLLSPKWFNSAYVEINSETILETGVYYYQNKSIQDCFNPNFSMVTVVVNNCVDLIPTAFSPNGDGRNDTYNLINIPYHFPNYEMTILNRYGKLVYKGQNGWTGTLLNKGEVLENGVYYMYLDYKDTAKQNSEHIILIQK